MALFKPLYWPNINGVICHHTTMLELQFLDLQKKGDKQIAHLFLYLCLLQVDLALFRQKNVNQPKQMSFRLFFPQSVVVLFYTHLTVYFFNFVTPKIKPIAIFCVSLVVSLFYSIGCICFIFSFPTHLCNSGKRKKTTKVTPEEKKSFGI